VQNLVFHIKGRRWLRVFENRVQIRIVGPKRDEVTGGYRKLHNEELHNVYSLPNIISHQVKDEMGRACSMHGERRAYRILVRKLEGKKSLGRPLRWEDINMDLREI
jgi:hypothetical protein